MATSTVPFAARQLIEKFAELRWQRRLQDLLSVGAEYRAERVDDEMVSLAGFIG